MSSPHKKVPSFQKKTWLGGIKDLHFHGHPLVTNEGGLVF